ncbi:3'-5' RNA helicase YTHDC2 isoform X1 [Hydra vulgaris]|uniref:3'-5' RNA helicase YTHDC2 isoform X1 n=2 Tax=Hydra vulgaris TaxID=6087 RepID=UPI001F5EE3B2|nr:3'-5' RNA helicase YTHDC2 isoform X2 [Hydra vulgaris]
MDDRKNIPNKRDGKIKSDHNKPSSKKEICIGEEVKIAVAIAIDRFKKNEAEKELEFPSSFTAQERAYVHRYCRDLNLISKSRGIGNKRCLTVLKTEKQSSNVNVKLNMTKISVNAISTLLSNFPVTSRDRHELSGQKLHKGIISEQNKILNKENRLVLGSSGTIIPPEPKETEAGKCAKNLPIFHFKEQILKTLKDKQVLLISGDTGSGKTTQVGQYILESCRQAQKPCHIICSQPRRLSAISVSERVASERGERIGQTVGYQVRLDSKLSPKTVLQFCTTGVLLRLLMVGHKSLVNVSHVIVDEIHERDSFTDFLLICLRDLLKSYKKLKLILMSAALNVNLFKDYFEDCPTIHVSGNHFNVQTFFLEDALRHTGYVNKAMKKLMRDSDKNLFWRDDLANQESVEDKSNDQNESFKADTISNIENIEKCEAKRDSVDNSLSEKQESNALVEGEELEMNQIDKKVELLDISQDDELKHSDEESIHDEDDDEIIIEDDENPGVEEQECDINFSEEMDSYLAQAWLNGDDEAFDQIIHLILNENVNINYQHSHTKMTALIVAAARGNLALTEQLVELGANLHIRDPNNKRDAFEWASHFNQDHVVEFLHSLISGNSQPVVSNCSNTEEDHRRLELYHKSFDDQRVDINLIMALISSITKKTTALQGAILVFLPGYDEIITLRDSLIASPEFSSRAKYQILLLHSMIPPSSQRKVFTKPPLGVRKIILSTNLAETSITIDDVVYVIDSGKVKENSHDPINSASTLRTVWISKASAMQRRGRAGRCSNGICYHLFSQERFQHLQLYQDAEILRIPIHSLCLQSKMLAPVNISIADYLSKAPEPPSILMIRNSIHLLKAIGALDENEDMTDLGKVLVEIPIEPQAGKLILMGLTLKCLEPAIIIACCSSFKDLFVLPVSASQKSLAANVKFRLSADSFSDQICLLRAFQGWQHAKRAGREKLYCSKNFLSPGIMEMVSGMRRQIILHLRNLGFVRSHGAGDIRDLNLNSRNWAVIKAVVGAGMYPNIMQVDRENLSLISDQEKKVNIHNSSVLLAKVDDKLHSEATRVKRMKSAISRLPFDWVVYEELSRLYYSVQIRCVSILSPVALSLMCGPCMSYEHSSLRIKSGQENQGQKEQLKDAFFQESDSEEEDTSIAEEKSSFKLDDWISFTGEDHILYSIAMLRIKFLALFSKRIQIPAKSWNQVDDHVVQCIVNILTKEEQSVGVTNPATKDIDRRMAYEKRSDKFRYKSGPHEGLRKTGNYEIAIPDWRTRQTRGKKVVADQDDSVLRDEKGVQINTENEAGCSEVKRRPASYFIMKCNNDKNMSISFERNIWATTRGNEKRLNRAFNESDEVFLIFSVQGSGHFQGVAKMTSEIGDRRCEDFGSLNLGGLFNIEWIHQEEIAFQYTQHLCNPWNDNKKVQISRDAQELETNVGKSLVEMWLHNSTLTKDLEQNEENLEQQDLNSPSLAKNNVVEEAFYSDEVYSSNDPAYMDGYTLYSPPPFSPQYMPEFQHIPPFGHPQVFQQPYPMYAPPGGQIYRHQDYYIPQYPPPRRNTAHDYYRDEGWDPRNSRGNYRQ